MQESGGKANVSTHMHSLVEAVIFTPLSHPSSASLLVTMNHLLRELKDHSLGFIY